MTAAIFVFAGVVSVAAARDAAKTTVTIHYNGDGFQGKLKSSKGKCIRNRTVKVFKKSNGQKLYTDTSDRDGRWNTGNSGPDPRHVLCPHPQDPGLPGGHEQVDPHVSRRSEDTTKGDSLDSKDASDRRGNSGHLLDCRRRVRCRST